ncbi:MAG: [NiFe]-hydrogenase assembly chaperone HybE [Woeseiaceae bacterium]
MISSQEIVARYQTVYVESMRDLPICNPELEVEVIGPITLNEHQLGVLITPWFMNLILLPGDETWKDEFAGAICSVELPSAPCEFTVCQDEFLGTFLSAVLFHSVNDFADHETAVAVAGEALLQLLQQPREEMRQKQSGSTFSRRSLLSGLGSR